MIYGALGLVGKDYDMPVAVLSSMALGLAVDYAIHFLARGRFLYNEHKTWAKTTSPMFGEPARAIFRNVIVIGLGFLPLLAAPLMPYKTVGIFMAAILLAAGLASLLILPALLTLLEKYLFPKTKKRCMICNCATCIISAVSIVGIVGINLYSFFNVGWTKMTWVSLLFVVVSAQACWFIGRSKECKVKLSIEG